ncbi:hypothetical protein AYK25_08070 [Thermoplasmatales archaeon SM1-50]|nr:MAG: hypothetical protein AYK25_08070 [Thermoplasmatales archaeon SM1-50]
MNDSARLGMVAGILLILLILIGTVSATVLVTISKDTSEEDLNIIVGEIVDEMCNYLQIKHIVGKSQMIQGVPKINKIAILIKPLVSQNIDMSHMIIEVCDGEYYQMIFFNGLAESLNSSSLFEHPIWNSLTPVSFSLLSTIDDDNSIVDLHLINKNTDMTLIVLKLSDNIAMKKGAQLEITILPSPGIGRTIHVEAPLSTKNIVTLYP